MCGISAYIGFREAYPIVINGLKRLEYRGYDPRRPCRSRRGAVVCIVRSGGNGRAGELFFFHEGNKKKGGGKNEKTKQNKKQTHRRARKLPQGAADEHALQRQRPRVAALRDRVRVRLPVARRRVRDAAGPERREPRELEQRRRRRLDRREQRVGRQRLGRVAARPDQPDAQRRHRHGGAAVAGGRRQSPPPSKLAPAAGLDEHGNGLVPRGGDRRVERADGGRDGGDGGPRVDRQRVRAEAARGGRGRRRRPEDGGGLASRGQARNGVWRDRQRGVAPSSQHDVQRAARRAGGPGQARGEGHERHQAGHGGLDRARVEVEQEHDLQGRLRQHAERLRGRRERPLREALDPGEEALEVGGRGGGRGGGVGSRGRARGGGGSRGVRRRRRRSSFLRLLVLLFPSLPLVLVLVLVLLLRVHKPPDQARNPRVKPRHERHERRDGGGLQLGRAEGLVQVQGQPRSAPADVVGLALGGERTRDAARGDGRRVRAQGLRYGEPGQRVDRRGPGTVLR